MHAIRESFMPTTIVPASSPVHMHVTASGKKVELFAVYSKVTRSKDVSQPDLILVPMTIVSFATKPTLIYGTETLAMSYKAPVGSA